MWPLAATASPQLLLWLLRFECFTWMWPTAMLNSSFSNVAPSFECDGHVIRCIKRLRVTLHPKVNIGFLCALSLQSGTKVEPCDLYHLHPNRVTSAPRHNKRSTSTKVVSFITSLTRVKNGCIFSFETTSFLRGIPVRICERHSAHSCSDV